MANVAKPYRHHIHRMLPELRRQGDVVYIGCNSYADLKTYLKRYFIKINKKFKVQCTQLYAKNPDRQKFARVFQVIRLEDVT